MSFHTWTSSACVFAKCLLHTSYKRFVHLLPSIYAFLSHPADVDETDTKANEISDESKYQLTV